jgi:toluene monooxygenase system protein D
MSASKDFEHGVGPVLHTTPFALTVVSVIEDENHNAVIVDEGAYLRVLASPVCRLSRVGLETAAGPDIRFPGDLEVVMSSFAGVMELTEDGAVWRLSSASSVDPDAVPKYDP